MATLAVPVSGSDHGLGPGNASVTLVEYGDYESTFCIAAHPLMKHLLAALPDMRLIYRHFPLAGMHPHARRAACAAEAAGKQDAFWEMHDMLYSHADALEDDALFVYAKRLDLDMAVFRRDIDSAGIVESVGAQFIGVVRSGVNATPSFFVDGVRYDGPRDVQSMERILLEHTRPA